MLSARGVGVERARVKENMPASLSEVERRCENGAGWHLSPESIPGPPASPSHCLGLATESLSPKTWASVLGPYLLLL